MKTPPRVQLVQSWQTYSKGQFLWPDNATVRNWLIATGRAVLAPNSESPKKAGWRVRPKGAKGYVD